MILEEAAARRLARAIIADATLYGGGDHALGDPGTVAEMRELFASRVSGSLLRVLDEEIAARGGGASASPPVSSGPSPARVESVGGFGPALPVVVAVALAVGVLLLGGAMAFLVR